MLSEMRRPPDHQRDRGIRTRPAASEASARVRSAGPAAALADPVAVAEGRLMLRTDRNKTTVVHRLCLNSWKRSGFMDVWRTETDRAGESAGKALRNGGNNAEIRQQRHIGSTAFQASACKPHSAEYAKRVCPTDSSSRPINTAVVPRSGGAQNTPCIFLIGDPPLN